MQPRRSFLGMLSAALIAFAEVPMLILDSIAASKRADGPGAMSLGGGEVDDGTSTCESSGGTTMASTPSYLDEELPFNESAQPGDIVMLKSGGPLMLVEDWVNFNGEDFDADRVVCLYPVSCVIKGWIQHEEVFQITCLDVVSRDRRKPETIDDGESHRALEAARIMREHGLHPIVVCRAGTPLGREILKADRLYKVAGELSLAPGDPTWISSGTWPDPVEAMICAEAEFLEYVRVSKLIDKKTAEIYERDGIDPAEYVRNFPANS